MPFKAAEQTRASIADFCASQHQMQPRFLDSTMAANKIICLSHHHGQRPYERSNFNQDVLQAIKFQGNKLSPCNRVFCKPFYINLFCNTENTRNNCDEPFAIVQTGYLLKLIDALSADFELK